MKTDMKKVMLMSLMVMVATMMTSCMSIGINNDRDNTPTQVHEINQVTVMQPFNDVDIVGPFKIIYEQGEQHTVRIEASEQELNEMTVYVKEKELRIRKSVAKPTVSLDHVKVYVTSPDIQKIDLAGSGVFAASNPITASDNLDVDIAGSGKVLLAAVTCDESNLEIAGSGDIEIGSLTAKEVNTDIAGSGNINLEAMTCINLDIEIAGSGDVSCGNIKADKAHIDIAGSGDVNLKGTVQNFTKDIAGSGKVNISELKIGQSGD